MIHGILRHSRSHGIQRNVEEYPEIKTMLESEQRFEIVGVLRRMPQNFHFLRDYLMILKMITN